MIVEWEILAGLPPYGPLAKAFAPRGRGTFREGLVVRVSPRGVAPWVGNFQRAWRGLDAVRLHPDGARLVVVAGALAYVVDPVTQRQIDCFGGDIEHAVEMPAVPALALGGGSRFTILFADTQWITPDVGIDGLADVSVEDTVLRGVAGDPMYDEPIPFEIDVAARRVR